MSQSATLRVSRFHLNRYTYHEKTRDSCTWLLISLRIAFFRAAPQWKLATTVPGRNCTSVPRIPTEVGTIATATKNIAARRLPHAYCSDRALRILSIKNLPANLRANRNVSCSKKPRSSCFVYRQYTFIKIQP